MGRFGWGALQGRRQLERGQCSQRLASNPLPATSSTPSIHTRRSFHTKYAHPPSPRVRTPLKAEAFKAAKVYPHMRRTDDAQLVNMLWLRNLNEGAYKCVWWGLARGGEALRCMCGGGKTPHCPTAPLQVAPRTFRKDKHAAKARAACMTHVPTHALPSPS